MPRPLGGWGVGAKYSLSRDGREVTGAQREGLTEVVPFPPGHSPISHLFREHGPALGRWGHPHWSHP